MRHVQGLGVVLSKHKGMCRASPDPGFAVTSDFGKPFLHHLAFAPPGTQVVIRTTCPHYLQAVCACRRVHGKAWNSRVARLNKWRKELLAEQCNRI